MSEILETPIASTEAEKLRTLTQEIFATGGHLEVQLGLEHRPQQAAMAHAAAKAFGENTPLLFEAGTGVGKSLAYLIPGILKAVREERPFIVSTHTKSLQEQILKNDLELCRELFKKTPELAPYQDFKSALLVGRANYLCTTRLAQAIQSHTELFPTKEQEELERIAAWAEITQTGCIEELNPAPSFSVWDWVHADATSCNPKSCSPHRCFHQKAKALQRKANIIIVNHSLLFSLIGAGMAPGGSTPGILYPDDFCVLDEAHTVPDIARDHFGIRISTRTVLTTLKMLYNPTRKKGLLSYHGHPSDCKLVALAILEAENFFEVIREDLLNKRSIVRLLEPDWMDTAFCNTLQALIDRLKAIIQRCESENVQNELKSQYQRLQGYRSALLRCIALDEPESVFWAERIGLQSVALRSAPIDAAPHLERTLFARHTSCVLTSATLAQGQSMDHFQGKAGAKSVPYFIEDSPFDFERNTQVYVATDAPVPSAGESRLDTEYLANTIHFCSEQVPGGTLVLFTSYIDMHRTADILAQLMESSERPLLIQGRDTSRSELVAQFKDAGNAVLLGTDSFWTGVDVPGPALSQVIITRLPFENPSHPVAQAMGEWTQNRGGNPFMHLTLPEALIQFRQGLGRLIRKKEDKGIITLLDGRLLKKNYGRYFLNLLPRKNYRRFNQDNRELVFESNPLLGCDP